MKKICVTLSIATLALLSVVGLRSVRAGAPPDLPAGSASVKGIVKFEGVVPPPKHINMSADPSCAKLHPSGVNTEDVVADKNGGLENVVVFVSEGLGDRSFDAPGEPAVMEQKGCMYAPHVVVMQAHQKLDVKNDDPTMHNIHPQPTNNREWNKAQTPGAPVEETFAREEIAIPVKCNVHPWMHSYIAVFKHPFYALSGKGGSFDLKSLPPGTYTLEAWHERLGTATQKVTVGANETKEVQFVFKGKPGA